MQLSQSGLGTWWPNYLYSMMLSKFHPQKDTKIIKNIIHYSDNNEKAGRCGVAVICLLADSA